MESGKSRARNAAVAEHQTNLRLDVGYEPAPAVVSELRDEIAAAWQTWSDIFALPQLPEETVCEPAPRRRRRNAIRARRPKFLVRRLSGGPLDTTNVHRDEREIIARN